MRTSRIAAATLLAAGLTLAPMTMATAATGTGTDLTGDVSGGYDITKVDVANTLDEVSVTITTDGVVPAANDPIWNTGGLTLSVDVRRNGETNTENPVLLVGAGQNGIYVDGNKIADLKSLTVDTHTIKVTAEAPVLGTPARVDVAAAYGVIDTTTPANTELDVAILDDATATESAEATYVKAQEPGGQFFLGADGGVFSLGDAQFAGSTGGKPLNAPVLALAANNVDGGYWFVAADGGVFTFGEDNEFHGSTGNLPLNQPIVGIAPTSTGQGYWLVARDGGVFAFGDAKYHGSTGNITLNQPIVGIAPTADDGGYNLVAADGGVFSFGNAEFQGSTGNITLNQPIVDIANDPDGSGYWLLAKDGGVFSFDAEFRGSAAGTNGLTSQRLEATSFVAEADGYRIVANNGSVRTFGDLFDYGGLPTIGVNNLNAPIVDSAWVNPVT